MQICVVGTGYVGLVAGTCLADLGHTVVCVDKDAAKIEGLKQGVVPIYEPGLDHLIHRNVREARLQFTTDGTAALRQAEVAYIAVGTPSDASGAADLSGVMAVAELIGTSMEAPQTVVIKSTVPVGTADRVRAILSEHSNHDFDVVSNPEFLKEGAAIDDFMKPDRIVVGCQSEATQDIMKRLYGPLLRTSKPILFMSNRSAELTKYTANAFLATRISFINEIARVCEAVGADVEDVRRGAGSDSRIGLRFFFPGIGYGGSCFPKDVKALMTTAREAGEPLQILDAVEAVNAKQKSLFLEKIQEKFGQDLEGLRFGLWGLSFKPQTDDMREAPSLVLIQGLLERGAKISAYDPEAMEEARHILGDSIRFSDSKMEAIEGVDALVLVTEWHEFRNPNWKKVGSAMRQNVVFDGRNIFEPSQVREAGFEYHGVGRL
ncbi:MAG: UDP-glucose/GDP-mannose dehydrogenase family protein [Myxococcota bacterium]|nr:UDP-glucose/GDP-mannose dehydrogenase family protein [Myxococcota bacterium]